MDNMLARFAPAVCPLSVPTCTHAISQYAPGVAAPWHGVPRRRGHSGERPTALLHGNGIPGGAGRALQA
jgi:hypothetical protein